MWGIELRRNSGVPLSRQIYGAFRDRIMDGRMKPEEALPSTRELAAQLAVSRNTVCEAYDMLLAEAFVESRQGSATRVAGGVQITGRNHAGSGIPAQPPDKSSFFCEPVGRPQACEPGNRPPAQPPGDPIPADDPENRSPARKSGSPPSGITCDSSAEGPGGRKPAASSPPSDITCDFRTGLPDLHRFPLGQWLRLMHKASESLPLEQWGYAGPEGLAPLREEIASWLFRSRGMEVQAENVYITAGATHALHILSELLYTAPYGILVEDPCHTGMLRTLKSRGYQIIPIPADEHGIRTEYLDGARAKTVYVTPSHQFPLGGILPAARRAALIRYARENGAYIIEDDYDSEFRYAGPPIAPLHAMDPERVVYVGTFSKILFPALRVGYVVLPYDLQERWRYLRIHTDVQNPVFEQAALAEFMHSRRFDRHVRQMRKLYGQRRQALLQALEEEFGNACRSWGDAAGLHTAVEFPGRKFDRSFVQKSRETGINIRTVEHHCIQKGRHQDKLLLGYGHLSAEEIQSGIRKLGKIF